MSLARREFLIAAGAIVAGCDRESGTPLPPNTQPTTVPAPAARAPAGGQVDAGTVSGFAEDGVYDGFREQGVFIIRRDKKVFALSSICTHKGCKVRAQEDGSFLCRCHRSTFDRDGRVTKGPATRDLPRLPVATDERNHLLVKLG